MNKMSKNISFLVPEDAPMPIFLTYFQTTPPFPLNLHYNLRVLVAGWLLVVLSCGLKVRLIMYQYLCNSDTKFNPINRLTYVHLLSGTFLGSSNLTFGIASILLPEPLSSYYGEETCGWMNLSGSLNLNGYIIWTTLIAICRIMYIKAQNWTKYKLGEKRLFSVFLSIGLCLQLCLSIAYSYYDDANMLWKLCSHHSQEDIETLQLYKVS